MYRQDRKTGQKNRTKLITITLSYRRALRNISHLQVINFSLQKNKLVFSLQNGNIKICPANNSKQVEIILNAGNCNKMLQ